MKEQLGDQEIMPNIKVVEIAPGLGYGVGTIGVKDRLESSDDLLDQAMLDKVDDTIMHGAILVPVDRDDTGAVLEDDGCGDGRGVKIVRRGMQILKRSLHRAKVFGGGLAMTVAAKIANGSKTGLEDLFISTVDELDEQGIEFGAHTDDHAHGENCGCGALDKAPAIVENALVFRDAICAAAEALTGIKSADNKYLKETYAAYELYVPEQVGKPYAGSRVMSKITKSGKIVKELEGKHKEVRIVINTIEGYTVDQGLIRDISDGEAQVFAVDEWRLRDRANKLYKDEDARERGYNGMLVYTLATAGTLTPGDLKVYAILANNELATAA